MTEHDKYVQLIEASQATEAEKKKLIEKIFDVTLEVARILRTENESLAQEVHYLRQMIKALERVIADRDKTIREIAEWSENEIKALNARATHDRFGLLQEDSFREMARYYIARERRTHLFAYGVIDLIDFKGINDNYGHPIGDLVLEAASKVVDSIYDYQPPLQAGEKRHSETRTEFDIGCRLGDEFIFLVSEIGSEGTCWKMAERLFKEMAAISIPTPKGIPLVRPSIGIVCVQLPPAEGRNFLADQTESRLFTWADGLMYEAKQYSKSRETSYPSDFIRIKALEFRELWDIAPNEKQAPKSIRAE